MQENELIEYIKKHIYFDHTVGEEIRANFDCADGYHVASSHYLSGIAIRSELKNRIVRMVLTCGHPIR